MRIGRVALQDFGPYDREKVIFDQPLSVIRADNAGGKSKLAQSIQLSLTRQSFGTDGRGAGADDKIRLGTKKAIVTLGVDTAKGPMELVTTYDPGRSQVIHAGFGGPEADDLAKGFEGFLEVSKERLSCVLDSEFFIGQKPAEQKAILAALVLPAKYDWESAPGDAAMKVLAMKFLPKTNWARPPVAVIDEVYGDQKSGVYALRTAAKATLAGIYISAVPAKPEHDSNEVQAKLNVLRVQQTKEAKKVKQGGTVQLGRAEQSLEQERKALAQAQTDLQSTRNRQTTIDGELLDGPTLTAHRQMAAKREIYNDLAQQIGNLDNEIAAQTQAEELFADLLTDEGGNIVEEACCPTCTQPITREFIRDKVAAHEALRQEAAKDKEKLMRKQAALGDIAGAEAALKAHEQKTAAKLEAVKAVTVAGERIQTIEAAIKNLEAALANAKAAEANPIDTSALDALTAEIALWEGYQAPALTYAATLEQIDRAMKLQAAQQMTVNELESLCAFFGAKGLKARLVDQHIGAFTDTINGVLAAWGYRAVLSIEPYSFEVQTPKTGERFLPLKELSGFERLAFGVALQAAIAVHSKLRVILVDRADTMIAAQRNRLLGCIKAMLDNGTLEQAIVMLADTSRTVPEKTGVGFYFIENEKVVRL